MKTKAGEGQEVRWRACAVVSSARGLISDGDDALANTRTQMRTYSVDSRLSVYYIRYSSRVLFSTMDSGSVPLS